MPEPDAPLARTNGGSRPIPDPTELTERAITKLDRSIHEYVDAQLAIRDERLRGIDEATKLRLGAVEDMPRMVETAVGRLEDLTTTRFVAMEKLSERESALNKDALVAAFNASKEAVAAALTAQKESAAVAERTNQAAIDKSERATADTIRKNEELATTRTDAQAKDIAEVKERLTRVESVKVGATESRTGLYAGLAALGAVIGIVLAVAAVLATRGP